MNADKLLEMARATRDAALLRIREDFHKRWGTYWKCGRCGGPLSPTHVISHAPAAHAKKCPHGDHEIVLVNNGYSWTNR